MRLAFLDTETTGLDPERHEIWEVALITRDITVDGDSYVDEAYHWFLPVSNFQQADPFALKIGRLMERHPYYVAVAGGIVANKLSFAREFYRLTEGAHIAGAVPSFDTIRLEKLLNSMGYPALWHYHLIDVENLVAGYFRFQPPYKSEELSRDIGINPDNYERHTAMGDCEWARDMYDKVMFA